MQAGRYSACSGQAELVPEAPSAIPSPRGPALPGGWGEAEAGEAGGGGASFQLISPGTCTADSERDTESAGRVWGSGVRRRTARGREEAALGNGMGFWPSSAIGRFKRDAQTS